MRTVRQVKTVFVIFVAFVCCWTPYAVVLLCDSSDTLPLSVHLYTSMIAHLHASLNFAIYGLMNRNVHSGFAAYLMTRLNRVTLNQSATYDSCAAENTLGRVPRCAYGRRGYDGRALVSAEYLQLQDTVAGRRNAQRCDRRQASSL